MGYRSGAIGRAPLDCLEDGLAAPKLTLAVRQA